MTEGAEDLANEGVRRAKAAAQAVYLDPKAPVPYEPEGEQECAAAVAALAACFAGAGGTVEQMMSNARSGTKVLSGDRLQGLSEIIQNADDAGATYVHFMLQDGVLRAEHDGRPLRLKDVHALAAPWLTTKADDVAATGRFGVGLLTLHALARVFDMHNESYHLRLGDPTVSSIDPSEHATKAGRTTLVLTPDAEALTDADLMAWARQWNDEGLLFLRHVRKVKFSTDREHRNLSLSSEDVDAVRWDWADHDLEVRRTHKTTKAGDGWWVYAVDIPSPAGLQRANKEAAETTALAVALPDSAREGHVFAGLPVAKSRRPTSVNAQFDPIASRQDFADNDWNRALIQPLVALWARAILDGLENRTAEVWALFTLTVERSEERQGGLLDQLDEELDQQARYWVSQQAYVSNGSARWRLQDLAYEDETLSPILTLDEVADIAGAVDALPAECRDRDGVWREVLAWWRGLGQPVPIEVTVADALPLVEQDARNPRDTIRLVAAGVRAGEQANLEQLRCVILQDGTRVTPPQDDELRLLATVPSELGAGLNVIDRLHPAYLTDDLDAATVLQWHKDNHALYTAQDDARVLELLARAGSTGAKPMEPLDEAQVEALRLALEHESLERRQDLGPAIGRVVQLSGYTHDSRGRRISRAVLPAEAYLPTSIERLTDGFGFAAGTTPGLLWVDKRYATILKSAHGRPGLGALKFLKLLGAEVAPRLRPHPLLDRRYAPYRVGGLNAGTPGAPGRSTFLRDLQADHTLDDHEAPDLEAVLHDIAQDRKAGRRRDRAMAVIEVLGRGWASHYGENAEVSAVEAYHSWNHKGTARSWWLWSAGEIAWLDNAKAVPATPEALRLRTTATVAVHGQDDDHFLHARFKEARRDVLAALGVGGEPSVQDLLQRLRHLRSEPHVSDATRADTHLVYQALAGHISRHDRQKGISAARLRQAFSEQGGLVLARDRWLPPGELLSGDPIFGRYREFVPPVPETAELWATLQIRHPNVADCIEVLRAMAKASCGFDEDEAALLETFRLMAEQVPALPRESNIRRQLARIPLPTSSGWTSKRPVYLVEDLPLAQGLAKHLPVWRTGGDVSHFAALAEPLRLTPVATEDSRVLQHSDMWRDDDATSQYRVAVSQLREDLLRHDPDAYESIRGGWDELEEAEVWIARPLAVRTTVSGTQFDVQVSARLDTRENRMYLSASHELGRAQSAGRALATYFTCDPRGLAHAWLAAISAAAEGQNSVSLLLAAEQAAAQGEDARQRMTQRLEELRAGPDKTLEDTLRGEREKRPPTKKSPESTGGGEVDHSSRARPPRTLVDPDALDVVDPHGQLQEARPPGAPQTRQRTTKALPPAKKGAGAPNQHVNAREYTDLDKEDLGLSLVRRVLAGSTPEIHDLRTQHGVGADAVDELSRFYELKVYAGAEPDEIVLEDSQIRRALSTENFFLVVVSGLEGSDARPQVRVIVNPVGQLRTLDRSKICFGGVRDSQSLVFRLRPRVEGGDQDQEMPSPKEP